MTCPAKGCTAPHTTLTEHSRAATRRRRAEAARLRRVAKAALIARRFRELARVAADPAAQCSACPYRECSRKPCLV